MENRQKLTQDHMPLLLCFLPFLQKCTMAFLLPTKLQYSHVRKVTKQKFIKSSNLSILIVLFQGWGPLDIYNVICKLYRN